MIWHAIAYALLAATLVTAAVTDWRTGKIFNWLTYPAILIGLLYWLIVGLAQPEPAPGIPATPGIVDAMIGFAAGLIPFAILISLGGLGGGDMKLMAAVGALSASWQVVLATTVYGLLIAAAFAIVLMVRHRLVKRTLLRIFGAALAAAAKTSPDLPDDSPRVPFGAAAALGGLLAAAEQMLNLQTPWAWLGP